MGICFIHVFIWFDEILHLFIIYLSTAEKDAA